jgi:hypothetical protein
LGCVLDLDNLAWINDNCVGAARTICGCVAIGGGDGNYDWVVRIRWHYTRRRNVSIVRADVMNASRAISPQSEGDKLV